MMAGGSVGHGEALAAVLRSFRLVEDGYREIFNRDARVAVVVDEELVTPDAVLASSSSR